MARPRRWTMAIGLAAAAIFVGAVLLAAEAGDVPVKILTRDPHQAAKVKFWYGYASLVGSALWIFGAGATLAAALAVRALRPGPQHDPGLLTLLMWGGVLGTVMAFDDQLLFHDAWARRFGIRETLFHLVYAAAAIALATGCARTMLRSTAWPLYALALAGFGASSTLDLVTGEAEVLRQSEDLFKLGAIVLWTVYFADVGVSLVRSGGAGDAGSSSGADPAARAD